jgi:site-specific DNA-cytosine methylase
MYDGMSCGHIALDKLGAKITNYYATEIDKYAIKTTIANYPKTIYLGDAFNVRKNDFVVAEPKRRKIDIKIVKGEQISLF